MSDPVPLEPATGGLTCRFRAGNSRTAPAVVLLHGLGGDERVVWVLETALPSGTPVVAPRGPYALPESGRSWVSPSLSGWPDWQAFAPAVESLAALIEDLADRRHLESGSLILMGFSQGAALAFAVAADPRIRPLAVIAASGFLPAGPVPELDGLPVYWGHGTRDDRVPIARARGDVERLRQAGAEVTLCETEVGHKLGVECLRGLRIWLRQRIPGLSEA